MKGPDKDRRYRLMNELLKTNQKHIEHLKQMTDQLKKVSLPTSRPSNYSTSSSRRKTFSARTPP
jgi:hypothetical protein